MIENNQNKGKTMIKLTEKLETWKSQTGHKLDGTTILTITLWADDERIDTFGGGIADDHDKVRARAAQAANDWAGLTGAEVKSYDAFVSKMDRQNWSL